MGAPVIVNGSDGRTRTLVWVDAKEAVIVRMDGNWTQIDRVESEVPAHHRATGHVRHDPAVRHGGGGPQAAGEPHRIEHLNRFVAHLVDRLGMDDDLLVLGSGTVHERLARQVSEDDLRHGRTRGIACEASRRLTDRQLIARLRRHAGVEQRRRSVGAYRWSQPSAYHPAGREQPLPRRVTSKPARGREGEAPQH